MRNISRFSGATVIGLNNNAYQVMRGNAKNKAMVLQDKCRLIKVWWLLLLLLACCRLLNQGTDLALTLYHSFCALLLWLDSPPGRLYEPTFRGWRV